MAYINTEKLFKCETCRRYIDGKCTTWCENYEGYSPNMKKIPTVDVVEVNRGHWVDDGGNLVPFDEKDGCPKRSCSCSECGEWLVASDEYPCYGNYCPRCGAKMDGKRL